MGRHGESDSDGRDWGKPPVAANRRRTDAPEGLWRGAPAGMSDHPTARESRAVGGRRSRRRAPCDAPAASRASEGARQVSRSRLPLPPVPAAARPAASRPPAGPRHHAAPFAAVPSPEPRMDLLVDDALPGRRRAEPARPHRRIGPGRRPPQPHLCGRRVGARVHRPQRVRRFPLLGLRASGAAPDHVRRLPVPGLRRLDQALPQRRRRRRGRRARHDRDPRAPHVGPPPSAGGAASATRSTTSSTRRSTT